jgi:hypothetical protein
MLKVIQSSTELQSQTDKQITAACMNVPTILSCKGGQVEVTSLTLIPDLEDAVVLSTSSVNSLNTHVVMRAEKVLECLRACKDLKRGIHLASWGISQAELAQKHKQEHVRELQLLHVPRAFQNSLLSGEVVVSHNDAQVKMLEKVGHLNRHMHVRSCTEPVVILFSLVFSHRQWMDRTALLTTFGFLNLKPCHLLSLAPDPRPAAASKLQIATC